MCSYQTLKGECSREQKKSFRLAFRAGAGAGEGPSRAGRQLDPKQLSHPDYFFPGVMGIIVVIGLEGWLHVIFPFALEPPRP